MIENEIYCYINGFLKWDIGKKTSYMVGNKKFSGKICILNFIKKKELTGKEDHKGNGQDLGNESLE